MAIQNRRGAYANFDKTKMVAGELAVVQSGDPANTGGKTIYVSFQSGDAKRIATEDDLTAINAETSVLDERLDAAEEDIEDIQDEIHDINAALADVSIDPDDLGLVQDEETSYVYPTYRGVRSSNGIYIANTGGGGGTSNTNLTVTNTTGWLSHTVSAGASCVLTFTWSSVEDDIPTGAGVMTITVGGALRLTRDIAQGSVSVDVGDYLVSGTNKVKLKVTDIDDNSKVITYTIAVVDLALTSNFDTSGTFAAGQSIDYTYTPTGVMAKVVYFVVDGTTVATATVTTSGRQQTQTLSGMTHGAHSLLVYFTATVDNETVTSNSLYYDLTVVNPESTTPIIASAFNRTTATQYETLSIPYRVYTPNSLTSDITLAVDNTTVSSLTVDRTDQTWTYRIDVTGSHTFKITTGSVSRSFTLAVSESDIDVHAETDALALYLTSQGRSNSEAHPEVWQDTDNNISCTLSNFNFVSDGWINDSEGITVLRVSGDARVTIPYKPFENDFRSTGKTIEVEFATRDVLNYDSTVMSCMSGDRGFKLTAQKASLNSEQSEISTQYKENEHVRIAFVVEKRSEYRLLYIYINGIMSGVVQYPNDDDFSQQTPVNITIGTNYCTTDIYCIRVYDNNLTRYQILDNWIADTQDITTMLNRYNRNNVYNEYGAITIDNLPNYLPYLVIACPELPQYKGDKKTVSGYYVDPVDATKSFSYTNAQADVQGTSSQYYPRKNYKIKFNGGFTMTSTGQTASTYAMRDTSVPTKTFTFKADVASSEGANNVELARLYNSTCTYQTPPQETNSKVRQGIDGFPIVVFWDNGTSVSFVGKQTCSRKTFSDIRRNSIGGQRLGRIIA